MIHGMFVVCYLAICWFDFISNSSVEIVIYDSDCFGDSAFLFLVGWARIRKSPVRLCYYGDVCVGYCVFGCCLCCDVFRICFLNLKKVIYITLQYTSNNAPTLGCFCSTSLGVSSNSNLQLGTEAR
jgi:hypothetical protein